jgi:hypothetical protein
MKQPDELSKSQVNQAIQSYEKLFNYPKTNQELNALKKTFYGNYQKLIESSTNIAQKKHIENLKQKFDEQNEIKRKKNNSNRISKELDEKYRKTSKYDLPKLASLARIGSFLESIKRIPINSNRRNIELNVLKLTLDQTEKFLQDYDEFNKYKEEYKKLNLKI